MSKSTLRKRIALTVVAALTTGVLSIAPAANAHNTTVSTTATNTASVGVGTIGASMFVATKNSSTGSAVVGALTGTTVTLPEVAAASLGLLAKDATSGTAQTATMLAGGTLSFYSQTGATDAAFVASAGSFAGTIDTGYDGGALTTYAQNQTKTVAIFDQNTGTQIAQLWTAPTTAGTYTVSLYVGTPTGDTILVAPAQGTLAAKITVTVVAASAGGTYSAAYSVCNTSAVSVVPGSTAATANVDSTATVTNGGSWYVNLALADSYANALDNGNIVVTATNGALVNYAEAGTASAGTASTVVSYNNANSYGSVTVTQPTANAPITTTVTITYNGTTVCTKTVSIRGEVAKIAVSNIATQDLSGTAGIANGSWIADGSGRAGLFTVLATDAAGNQVATSAIGTFSSDAASLAGQTIVSSITVDNSATATSSTAAQRVSTGIYACGATAGEVKTAKIKFTNTGTGNVVTSDAFTVRCADDPYTYTASWDKASYVQGELATLTVKFLDSKGFAANNNAGATGAWSGVMPMLTAVSATGTAPVLNNQGTVAYTFSVGTLTGITAGAYTSIIDFSSLTAVAAVKQTPSYKVSTGADTTTNADVLKSIVALIASINKQIQALQKLILKR
jgi:hypothetical protein